MFIRLLLPVLCALTTLHADAAHAEKRVALVIGNGAYVKVGKLPNAVNDANAIAALLRTAHFDVVEVRTDLSVAAMRRALRDFSEQVHSADIAVVFFAGHGIEVNGANYLIPVDAALERDIDVEDEAVPLERVVQIVDRAKRLRLVILDACRDNPFLPAMKRTIAGRSIGRGLARIDVVSSDTLIAFAAKHGSTASDGEGTNSPYTTALIRHLVTPGLDLRLALGRVRDAVLERTGSKQEPFVYGSLGGAEIALVPATKPAADAATLPPTASQPSDEAARAWAAAKEAAGIPALDAFIRRFGDTYYGDLAKVRLAELKAAEVTKEAEAARKKGEADTRAKLEAERICANVKGITNAQLLGAMATTHKGAPAEACIAARIEELSKQKLALAAPPPMAKEPERTLPSQPKAETGGDKPVPIIAAAGSQKAFSVKVGESVLLTSKEVALSVRAPDLQSKRIRVQTSERGVFPMRQGEEMRLMRLQNGPCRLALLDVTANGASFMLRC